VKRALVLDASTAILLAKVDLLRTVVARGEVWIGETAASEAMAKESDDARAIAKLPDRQRRVFVLKEMAGFKQTEISDILSMPQGTVKSLMHRAVKCLQRELSAYNPKGERIKCDAKTLSV